MSRAILFDAIFAIVFCDNDGDDCAFLMGVDLRMARWRVDSFASAPNTSGSAFRACPSRLTGGRPAPRRN
jgi:hypothetical protein